MLEEPNVRRRESHLEPFHIVVRKRLAELELRQRHLAEATGIGPSTLSAILNGRSPSHENLMRILEALQLHITHTGCTP